MQITTGGPGGRWLYTVAGWQYDELLALTTDSNGATIALIADSSYATPPSTPNIVLRKLDSNGYLIWEHAFQNGNAYTYGHSLGTDAAGNIYLLWYAVCDVLSGFCPTGSIDFGGGPTPHSALVKLSSTGEFIWQVDRRSSASLAVNASGESVFMDIFDSPVHVVTKARADGTIAWSRYSFGIDSSPAIDPSGNVLVGGGAEGAGRPFFGTSTLGPAVVKLAASDGATLWLKELVPVPGWVRSIGSSALGTVVMAAYVREPFSFAGQSFDAGEHLFVLESTGEPRFARRLSDTSTDVLLAVDPSGRVALVTTGGTYYEPGAFAVTWYNLAGDLLGQLNFPASTTSGRIWADAIAIASDHSMVVGGGYQGVANGSAFGVPGPIATGSTGEHAFAVGGLFRIGGPSFIDEFNRTSLGPNWQVTYGSFIDDGSAARGTSFGSYAFWTGVPGANDTAEITTTETARNVGAMVRAQAVPDRDHYAGYLDIYGHVAIARRRGYVYSYLAAGPAFPSGSHALSLTATGSSPVVLKVRIDGSTVLTFVDSSSSKLGAGGKVGMFDYSGSSQPLDRFQVIRR